jgi:hypothetical protein
MPSRHRGFQAYKPKKQRKGKCRTARGFRNCMSQQLKGRHCRGKSKCVNKFKKAARYCSKRC